LIVVGLPGDSEHEALFRSTALRWRDWLTGPLGFAPGEVRVLWGAKAGSDFGDAPATRESVAKEAAGLVAKSKPEDRAWVFVLGHANLDDGGHAFLHLPGPDFRDDEFGALFRGLAAKEEVFWMTNAASGAFLPALSKPGRVVIAATSASGEANETEFPHALADVVDKADPKKVDANGDGKISLQELFDSIVNEVNVRFAADNRAPSEHARLDDDGDGSGTESKSAEKAKNPDGAVASKMDVKLGSSDRSDHATRPSPPARAR
jgi:hypothetical protein